MENRDTKVAIPTLAHNPPIASPPPRHPHEEGGARPHPVLAAGVQVQIVVHILLQPRHEHVPTDGGAGRRPTIKYTELSIGGRYLGIPLGAFRWIGGGGRFLRPLGITRLCGPARDGFGHSGYLFQKHHSAFFFHQKALKAVFPPAGVNTGEVEGGYGPELVGGGEGAIVEGAEARDPARGESVREDHQLVLAVPSGDMGARGRA